MIRTRRLTAFPLFLIPILAVPAAQAGPNAHAKLNVHLTSVTTKQPCTNTASHPACSSIVTNGGLYPPNLYFAYLLVTDADATAGLQSVSFGVDYDGAPASGVDIFTWTTCGEAEFPDGLWPAPGTGNRVTWDPVTSCQRSEPGGAGTGLVASLGYFYCAAYTSSQLAVTGHPSDGKAHLIDCNAVEDAVPDSCTFLPFGKAGFGNEVGFVAGCGPDPGCPCDVAKIHGPTVVSPNSTGNVFTTDPVIAHIPTWTVTGDATISGSNTQETVLVDAGPSGQFNISIVWLAWPDGGAFSCSRDVLIDTGVPVETSSWGGIKALYR